MVGAGFGDFALGAATCTTNSDSTQDCLLPVTFKPTAPGTRTAPLTVRSGSGLVSTFALTGTGLSAVLAVDPGTQATLASTGLTSVGSIALDQAGNTYAVVPGASSIVKLSPAGAASNVGIGLAGATAVAVDPMGNVYAAVGANVVRVPASGAAQTTVGTGFSKPSGLAADAAGNLFVADSGTNQVIEIDSRTGIERVLATAASAGLSGPDGLAVDALGNLFIANAIANNVVELPFAEGAVPLTLGSGLSAPVAVATDAAGSVYVADGKNGRIVFLPNEAGTISTADQLVVATGLVSPAGVAVASGGTLTVADSAANAIYTFTRAASSVAFGNVPTQTESTSPADIVSAGNVAVTLGAAYFTEAGNTADFSLTPAALSNGTTFAPGLGASLTAGFDPTATGSRSAVFTFNTTNTAAPTLAVAGVGITPVDATTDTISLAPGNGT